MGGFSLHALSAGLLAAFVGFASSFAVIISGLVGVGASQAEAASGLMALSISMGICAIWLSLRSMQPISIAWSTPGSALLARRPARSKAASPPRSAPHRHRRPHRPGGLVEAARPLGRRDSGAGGERHAGRGAARALPGAGAAVAAFPLLGIHHHRRLGRVLVTPPPLRGARRGRGDALLIVFATDLPSAQLGSIWPARCWWRRPSRSPR